MLIELMNVPEHGLIVYAATSNHKNKKSVPSVAVNAEGTDFFVVI